MPDLMKCGGVTGWLRIAGQAEAASIPMSSHLFAEASSHMLAVTPTAHWLEVLDLARAILAEPIRSSMGRLPRAGPVSGLNGTKRPLQISGSKAFVREGGIHEAVSGDPAACAVS